MDFFLYSRDFFIVLDLNPCPLIYEFSMSSASHQLGYQSTYTACLLISVLYSEMITMKGKLPCILLVTVNSFVSQVIYSYGNTSTDTNLNLVFFYGCSLCCIYYTLLGLGYHKELKTRTSFIEVLSSILKQVCNLTILIYIPPLPLSLSLLQGAEFNSLADTALADRYNQLLDLVTMETDEGEHPIMIALINAIPFDNMVRNVSV